MTSTTSEDDPVAALNAARDRLDRAEEAMPADPDTVDVVVDAYERVAAVLDSWEERATDWDDFKGYIEFRNDLAETFETLPSDLPESDAFRTADEHVKTGGVSKSLSTRDFERAREALAPARAYADARSELAAARESHREARRTAERRLKEIDERIDDLERLDRLSEADLDAPIETLREPIATYNEWIEEAFTAFRRDASVRELLEFVKTAAGYPLVDYEPPPAELLEFVRSDPVGEQSLATLLEYANYSRSKLDHYVDDSGQLKRRVATNRTYLERISAEPLRVDWPPPPAAELRFRTEELVSVVGRIDDEGVAALRSVRALTRLEEYERLRSSAVVREELSDAERKRIESGAIADELAAANAERERLAAALEEQSNDG